MIQHKFLIFETQERFERLLRSREINRDSIVFIKKPLKIWTHDEYWDCSGSVDQAALEQILNGSDFLKQGDALGEINGRVFLQGDSITIETGEGIKYTAGEGIEINGTTINIKPATENTVGGIKLGYPAYGNNRPVQVDGLNRAYVTIPGGNGSGGSSKYYEMLFQATIGDNAPAKLPEGSNPNGWSTHVDNNDGKKVVWMITRLVDGDSIGPWDGPFRISGANGENGVDGDKLEFIYRLSNDGVNRPSLYDTNDQRDDYVPTNWTDNPSGINQDNKYEWMSFRTKVHSENDREGTWTRFMDPVLWSAWGKNGMDGDGVEYIFYTSEGEYPLINPYDWYNDSAYNTREYIRGGMPSTSAPNQWQDDPYDLNLMPQGSKTWVSVRKQTTGTNGQTAWGRYSNPALWAYYAKDGDAGIGIVADLDNDTMAVPLKANGYNETFLEESVVRMYNGTQEISTTARVVGIKDAANNSLSSYSGYVRIENGNIVVVDIPDETLDFSTLGRLLITIRCTSTINGETVSRDVVLQVLGINFGTGYNYSLKTSNSVIRKNKYDVISPEYIEVWCNKTSGNSPIAQWKPSEIESASALEFGDDRRFKFTCSIDDAIPSDLPTDRIQTDNITDNVTINLLYKYNSSWVLVDSETLYLVQDGKDGLTVPAVTYNIQVIKSTLQKTAEDDAKFRGTLQYKIQRVEGTDASYIADRNTYGVTTTVSYGGSVSAGSPTYGDGVWQIQAGERVWSDDYFFTQVNVKENGTVRTSIVVPTIINGKDGSTPEVQALSGKVIRMRVWEGLQTYNDGSVAENGVFYEDVVMYGNDLYRCIRSNTGGVLPTDTTYWEKFQTMSATSFEAMIANSAYIRNLTAKQIVITNDQNAPVAGIINGTYITSSEGLNEQVDNGVRIFAGTIPNNGSVKDTAFNVDQDGNVKAGSGKIELHQDGSGWIANKNIIWDSAGNITALSVNPLIGGSNFTGTNATTNAIMISDMVWESSDHQQYDTLHIQGFIIRHGFVLKTFAVGLPITMPDDSSVYADNLMYDALRNDSTFQNVFTNGTSVRIVTLYPYAKLNVYGRTVTDPEGIIPSINRYERIDYTYVFNGLISSWQNVTQ